MKWFPSDWIRDTRGLSPEAKAAWIDILATLHNARPRGIMTASVETWARIIGMPEDTTGSALRELGLSGVAQVDTLGNNQVSIINRRMQREEIAREKLRQRVAKYRAKIHEPKKKLGKSTAGNDAIHDDVTDRHQTPDTRHQTKYIPILPPDGGEKGGESDHSKPRERNILFDTLAGVAGLNISEIKDKGGEVGTALAKIKSSTPEVTPEEIRRRASNYRQMFPTITVTASGLAKHWPRLGGMGNIRVQKGLFET